MAFHWVTDRVHRLGDAEQRTVRADGGEAMNLFFASLKIASTFAGLRVAGLRAAGAK